TSSTRAPSRANSGTSTAANPPPAATRCSCSTPVTFTGRSRASLRAALAQYALGDDSQGGEDIVAPIEERVKALLAAIEGTEKHLHELGFERARLLCAKGFTRIGVIADATDV